MWGRQRYIAHNSSKSFTWNVVATESMTLKQSYEMDFQHCYKLWRVLNGREGMSLKSSWKSWTGLCTGLDWTGLDWTASLNTEWPLYSKMTTRTIIDLKYFSRNRKKMTPRKASFYLFFFVLTKKVCTVIFIERGYALSRLQNDKTYNIWYPGNLFLPLRHSR